MEATLVRDLGTSPAGAAQKLYRLSEPYDVKSYDGEVESTVEYVIVSAVVVPYTGPETYVFPADANGKVIGWGELEGSMRGALDHDAALAGFLSAAANV